MKIRNRTLNPTCGRPAVRPAENHKLEEILGIPKPGGRSPRMDLAALVHACSLESSKFED